MTVARDLHMPSLSILCLQDLCDERAITLPEHGSKRLKPQWEWFGLSPGEVNADERVPGHLRETSFLLARIAEERAAA
ncbi:MAG: hypothetical protein ACREQN_18605 [Candidatus Binataceae bacterium]